MEHRKKNSKSIANTTGNTLAQLYLPQNYDPLSIIEAKQKVNRELGM